MAYYCECTRLSENQREGGPCATCAHLKRKADRMALQPKKIHYIAKVAKKRKDSLKNYPKKKAEFIIGKICPIYPELKVEDIHHKRGRGDGYVDQWAKERYIILTMDQRFWLAVSRKGHTWIELHPKEARLKGYSLPRGEVLK